MCIRDRVGPQQRGPEVGLQPYQGRGEGRDGGQRGKTGEGDVERLGAVAGVADPPLPGNRPQPYVHRGGGHARQQQGQQQHFEPAEQRPDQAVVAERPLLPPPYRAGDVDPQQPPEAPALGGGQRRRGEDRQHQGEPQDHRLVRSHPHDDVHPEPEDHEQQEPGEEMQRDPQGEEGRIAGQPGERTPRPERDFHDSTVGGGRRDLP